MICRQHDAVGAGPGSDLVALGAQIAGGLAGALLILLIGTLFGIVTFGVLTANLALKSKDPAAVQAIFPMAYLLIFLTFCVILATLVACTCKDPASMVMRPQGEKFFSVQEKVPGFYFFLGGRKKDVPIDQAPAHHTPGFHVEDTDLEVGVKAFVGLVRAMGARR